MSVKTSKRDPKTFAAFCRQHKIATSSIKWRTANSKIVRLGIDKAEFQKEGLNLISFGIMLAIREFNVGLDVTIREKANEVEIVVER